MSSSWSLFINPKPGPSTFHLEIRRDHKIFWPATYAMCISWRRYLPLYTKYMWPAVLFRCGGFAKTNLIGWWFGKHSDLFFHILVHILAKLYFPVVSLLVLFLCKLTCKRTEGSIKNWRDSREKCAFNHRCICELEEVLYSRSTL